MAKNNADEAFELGKTVQRLKAHYDNLQRLAADRVNRNTMDLLAKKTLEELEVRQAELSRMLSLKGSDIGKVARSVAELAEKNAPKLLKIGQHAGTKILAGAVPVAGALSNASDVLASDDLGPAQGSSDYEMENNNREAIQPFKDEKPNWTQQDELNKWQNETNKKDLQNQADEAAYNKWENEPDSDLESKYAAGGEVTEKSLKKYDPEQLGKGIRTEMEHGPDANMALKTAIDHLKEIHNYYTKLEKVEGKKLATGGPSTDVKLQEGNIVPGKKEHYADDKVPAMLNKGELVLNVEQQIKALDKLRGTNTPLPKERLDAILKSGGASIDTNTQEQLFKYIKGESTEMPKGELVRYHAAEGLPIPYQDAGNADPLETTLSPMVAPNAPAQAPAAPLSAPLRASPAVNTLFGKEFNAQGGNDLSTSGYIAPQGVNVANAPAPTSAEVVLPTDAELASASQAATTPTTINNIQGFKTPEEFARARQMAESSFQDTERAASFDALNAQYNKQMNEAEAKVKQINDDIAERAHHSGLTNFFKDESTLGKIGFGIALAFSTLTSLKTGSNPILSYINQTAQNEIEKQRLNQGEALGLKNFILDQYKTGIEARSKLTSNAVAKDQAAKTVIEIGKEQQAVQQQQLAAVNQNQINQIANAGIEPKSAGLTRRQLEALSRVDKTYGERAVEVPFTNGQYWKLTSDPEAKKELEKKTADVGKAISSIDALKALGAKGKQVYGQKEKAKYETEANILIGQLRILLTGPGILTETEREMISDKVLGNPQQVLSFAENQNAKLDTFKRRLITNMKLDYGKAGAALPMTKREKLVNYNLSLAKQKGDVTNQGDIEDAIDRNVSSGKLSKDFSY